MRAPSAEWRSKVGRVLRSTFGLKRLRNGQEAVIERVMAGKHTLAVMPTGAGKSLCYQLPALMLPGRTVVVSPLIALMKDQCDKLRDAGVKAVQLNSATDAAESRLATEAVADGSARIVFTTPERLADPEALRDLRAHPVSLLVVDEAHCISQWGHDFRPAFLDIGNAVSALGKPVVLALTATATDEVAEDVEEQLGLRNLGVISTGVYRPNLHYRVEQVTHEGDKLTRVVALVREMLASHSTGSGIVYCATVKAVEAVHEALLVALVPATQYHGRLAARERHAHQDAFMAGEARVIVATNAFGLGIDKPDTRFVLHYQMPAGLDAYYQESGRAGRDGEVAHCTLLHLHRDKAVQQFFLANRYPSLDDTRTLYRALQAHAGDLADFDALQQAIDVPRAKLQVALGLLRRQRVVHKGRDGSLRLAREDLDDTALETLLSAYREKRERDRAMLERMVFYGQTGHCRWKVLLEHFDEAEAFDSCGTCDNCERRAQRLVAPEPVTQADTPVPSPHAAHEVGQRVQVKRYGTGQVIEADANNATVQFENGERRCFLATYVKTL